MLRYFPKRSPDPLSLVVGSTSEIYSLFFLLLLPSKLFPYEEDGTADMLDPSFTSRSPSPTKHPSRPPSRMSTLHTPHTLTRSPSPFWGSVSQLSEQSRAISLNDIMDNPTELEHFKVHGVCGRGWGNRGSWYICLVW